MLSYGLFCSFYYSKYKCVKGDYYYYETYEGRYERSYNCDSMQLKSGGPVIKCNCKSYIQWP